MKIGALITWSEKRRWKSKSPVVKLGATLAFVGLALILTLLLWQIADRPISSPLFLAAIVLSAWFCGLRYGILAALVGGFAIDYYFVPPFHAISLERDEVSRLLVFVAEGSIISWLVEGFSRVSDDVNNSREELRALTDYQQTLRESEQKRIALEIHDELGQSLTGLKMQVHLLKTKVNIRQPSDETSRSFDELMSGIDLTITTVRRIASELRPSLLDDFGLVAALEWQAREFERNTSIPCSFTADTESLDLGSDSNTAVYRIFQEAMTNVARHSGAQTVRVDLRRSNGNVVMQVADDGRGMPVGPGRRRSLGIIGMQERSRLVGGKLSIDSAGAGTVVELIVPFSAVIPQ